MHPYLAEQAAAHRDEVRPAARTTCCANLVARISLRDRLAAITDRLAAALTCPTRTNRAMATYCPA